MLTGWAKEDAAGRPLVEVFRLVDEQTRAPMERGLADRALLVARDGRELPIEQRGSPIVDDEGDVTGVVVVFRDVSHRREEEKAEVLRQVNDRVELALRGSQVAIWDYDLPEGDIATARLHTINSWVALGYESEAADDLASIATSLWHPDDRPRVE